MPSTGAQVRDDPRDDVREPPLQINCPGLAATDQAFPLAARRRVDDSICTFLWRNAFLLALLGFSERSTIRRTSILHDICVDVALARAGDPDNFAVKSTRKAFQLSLVINI